ncbi:hypothetical protein ACVCAH_33045 [Micromonospora sp. LZ34]
MYLVRFRAVVPRHGCDRRFGVVSGDGVLVEGDGDESAGMDPPDLDLLSGVWTLPFTDTTR